MNAAEIIRTATAAGIVLAAKGDRLSVVPAARLTPDLRLLLIAHKAEVLAYLGTAANDLPATAATSYGTGCDSRGRPLPPLVTCGSCANFRPNGDNPSAGCGTCRHGEPDQGRLPFYPGARRLCASFEVSA